MIYFFSTSHKTYKNGKKSSLIYWATVQNICLIPRCLKCLVHVENAAAGDQGVSHNGQYEH